jgi:hypothetical protein
MFLTRGRGTHKVQAGTNMYCEAGDLHLARDEDENVLQLQLLIFKRPDRIGVSDTILDIADLYQSRGNPPHILQAYVMAVQIYNRIEVRPETRVVWGIKWNYKIRHAVCVLRRQPRTAANLMVV